MANDLRCVLPRCRNEAAILHLRRYPICDRHWDRYVGDGSLNKRLGVEENEMKGEENLTQEEEPK